MLRKILFWAHLVAGVTAGLVILMMSFTGVLLTYDYQLIENADMKFFSTKERNDDERLPLESIIETASQALDKNISGVVIRNNPEYPYQVTYDRRGNAFVSPYTGELLGAGPQGIRNFLTPIRSWHRWFNVNGENREIARAITGASNVIFLFILISGLYLWLPRVWVVAAFKTRLWFRKAPTSKSRDYNWHHVFGFWSVIPLLAIVITATGFSYPSVKKALNDITAEPKTASANPTMPNISIPAGARLMSLNELLSKTEQELDDWYKITIAPAKDASSPAQAKIVFKSSMAPSQQATWSLNPYTGDVLQKIGWNELTTQEKANQVARRLHTGEFYGIVGQTIAGLVSLFACIMVWTGIALAWRRLISPLIAKRKAV